MTALLIRLLLLVLLAPGSILSKIEPDTDTVIDQEHELRSKARINESLVQELLSKPLPDEDIALVSKYEVQKEKELKKVDPELQKRTLLESGLEGAKPVKVNQIYIIGNKQVSPEAILAKIPYHPQQNFDPLKTRTLIRNLMETGYFSNVDLRGKYVDDNSVDLYIIVEEKKLVKEIIFKGNKHLSEKDIKKKISFADKPAMDESDVHKYTIALKRIYRQEKNYHNAEIKGELQYDPESDKVTVIFDIKENKQTAIQRVFFQGNKAFTDKQLRGLIFTREDWVLGFMDRAGSYQPEAIEADRQTLENFYQSNGYLNAKVTNVEIIPEENDPNTLKVTFHINEGDIYTVNAVSVQGNDLVPEKDLLASIPVKAGQPYSKENIRISIETLRTILGEHGYIYADVDPAVQPNDDDKTVTITFFTELGDKIHVRNVDIRGNEKTRQKIIRRKLLFDEGDLLTTHKLEESKSKIEQSGFFDQQGGVSWKIKRVNRDLADLELFVREIKTGRIDAQLGFGGSPKDLQNPTESLRVGGSISDTNLFGLGIGFNLSGEFSKQERQLLFNITEPWLFDRPIFAALDIALKKSLYEDFRFTKNEVKEQLANGSLSVGYIAPQLNFTKFIGIVGFEGLHYQKPPEADNAKLTDQREIDEFNLILQRRFPHGSFPWLGSQFSQDFRNHPLHPSRGYQWLMQSRIGLPINGQLFIASNTNTSPFNFGFWKFDFDASYYTPLIGERDLVFYFHTHLGIVGAFENKVIPYRELYHIGGPASVRGFLFGEIGPTFRGYDSLGAKKAFWLNTELIFPIAPDFSIKGLFFYDGGAGWDTPDARSISKKRLRNNHFSYRHSVGFGVRLLRPTPMRIDWGFKLDRKRGEKASEVHLSMSHDF